MVLPSSVQDMFEPPTTPPNPEVPEPLKMAAACESAADAKKAVAANRVNLYFMGFVCFCGDKTLGIVGYLIV